MTAEPAYLPWQARLLERAMQLKQSGHLPHAILIESSGSRDIGDFVFYLSMLLLCDASKDLALCRQCKACRMMLAGTYADFNLITLEVNVKTKKLNKNINIEQIRDLIHEVNLTSQYQRLKIAAIYPAETMNKSSANALLKTLEEPAPGVLMLLVTHNKGRIPVTIRSRCQVWSIRLPAAELALDWLREQGVETGEAERYLEFANGDPVLALHMKQQEYASLVSDFKASFGRFIRGDLSVSALCGEMKVFDNAAIRRLIDMTLRAYCLQLSGIDADGKPLDNRDPPRAQAMLNLQRQAERQLQVEENNLDLQLQLEDVLISLKQILSRRLI